MPTKTQYPFAKLNLAIQHKKQTEQMSNAQLVSWFIEKSEEFNHLKPSSFEAAVLEEMFSRLEQQTNNNNN